MRNLIIIFVVSAITGIIGGIVVYKIDLFFGLATWVLLFGSFIFQGLRKIPAQPPHKGILTIFGKRHEIVKDEGWQFFPFHPWWHGVILVNVKKKERDIPPETVRTPDLAESTIPIAITWRPSYNDTRNDKGKIIRKGGQDLIEYLNSGEEEGVNSILEGIISERLREWAMSLEEGPQNWQEAQGATEEAAAVLLKAVVGQELKTIPSSIPTPVLLKYFNEPKRKPTKNEAKRWGSNWKKVSEEMERLSDDERNNIKKAIENRHSDIIKARQGDGHFKIPQLGIELNRLNIGEIKQKGQLAQAAEMRAKEEQERSGEIYETETDLIKAEQLVKAVAKSGEKISLQEAFQIIMEWKATREGRGFAIPGISPAVAELVKLFLKGRS